MRVHSEVHSALFHSMSLRRVSQLLQFLERLEEGRRGARVRLANQTALVEALL